MILLDTHVWIWWVQGDPRLRQEAVVLLDAMAANSVAILAISCWEVAMLARFGRIVLPAPVEVWLADALSDPRILVIPVSAGVAICAALLPAIHKDPADRMLIAHAVTAGYSLVTEDARIHSYSEVQTLYTADLQNTREPEHRAD